MMTTTLLLYNNDGLISEGSGEMQQTKALKTAVPLTREPPQISAQALYYQKPESLVYIFVAYSMGLSSFKLSW